MRSGTSSLTDYHLWVYIEAVLFDAITPKRICHTLIVEGQI